MSWRAGTAILITARERAELVPFQDEAGDLGPTEVAGRTIATLVSAGTELNGNYLGTSFPTRPGYAAAFEVTEVGAGVRRVRPGDLVYCAGKHRSVQRHPEDEVIALPAGLDPRAAVFARLMGVSMTTLVTTRARPPVRVVVTGLGLVGHLAARIFATCGYRVTAVDPSPVRRAIAERAGLGDVRATVPLDDPTVSGRAALVVECSGHEGALLDGCRVVREGGEVVIVGTPWRARTELSAHELVHAVFHRYVTLRSGWEWQLPLQPDEFRNMVTGLGSPASLTGNLEAALGWLADGRIDPTGLSETASPAEAPNAYQRLLRDPAAPLSFVFDWTAG